jgi:SAM-dependent methyltransferase
MNEYREANLRLWNEWARIHAASDFYDVVSFKQGRNALLPLELSELGDVSGKRLLHLQCHFGMDTLSLARMGADVVGVDFSDEAIATARRLAAEIGVEATFVQSDIFELDTVAPEEWNDAFDIVYVTYGALEWLEDLRPWADLVARFLAPGGVFYMAEVHPYAYTLELEQVADGEKAGDLGDADGEKAGGDLGDADGEKAGGDQGGGADGEKAGGDQGGGSAGSGAGSRDEARGNGGGADQGGGAGGAETRGAAGEPSLHYRLVQTYPYFPGDQPEREEVQGSYADPDAVVENNVAYSWSHTIGEVIGLLLDRGLRLELFHEHPFCCAPFWPQMKKLDDGLYWLLGEDGRPRTDIPFLYSLRAHKPG